jgi:hypothetical protein
MNKGEEVQPVNHNSVYITLFLLHVSAFLESHHQAVKKYTKKDNLNTVH